MRITAAGVGKSRSLLSALIALGADDGVEDTEHAFRQRCSFASTKARGGHSARVSDKLRLVGCESGNSAQARGFVRARLVLLHMPAMLATADDI